MKTITIKEAVDQKLNSLTQEFKLPKEKWMMDNIIKEKAEVWRTNSMESWRSPARRCPEKK